MSRLRSIGLSAGETADWEAGDRRTIRRRALSESRAHDCATVRLYSRDDVLLDAVVADPEPRSSRRSGRSIPDAQRKRPARRVTLSAESWAWLDAHAGAGGVSGALDDLVRRARG